jgi:hypothetical protein
LIVGFSCCNLWRKTTAAAPGTIAAVAATPPKALEITNETVQKSTVTRSVYFTSEHAQFPATERKS